MSSSGKRLRVTVVGTGYVGLVTGACLAEVGHDVTCVDTSVERVITVNGGSAPFHEPGLEEMLRRCIRAGRLRATSDAASSVAASDVTFLAVGTPSTEEGIDLSFLGAAADEVGRGLSQARAYHVVVVKSTVVPGTTDTYVRDLLERSSGMHAGSFGLCMNPEFLREGSAVDDFMNPDRIVIGQFDEKSGERLGELYGHFNCPKLFTDLRNAEMTKYASNALLATLISFSNEFAALCEATPGTDIDEVLKALHLDRRFGTGNRSTPGILTYLRAGAGFGGSCLPKDVSAIRKYARGQQVEPKLLDAVAEVNSLRPSQLIALAESVVGSLQGLRIAVFGLAFKPGTDDLRDSPSLAVIGLLGDKRAIVKAFDPMIRVLPSGRDIELCDSPEKALQGADAAIIATAWPEFARWDWARLCSLMRSPIVIDGRNALKEVNWPLTTRYVPIGKHFAAQGAAGPTRNQHKLRSEILALVREYHSEAHRKKAFEAGKSRVNYSGRVYDNKEMENLVDAALDFWLTLGPYGEKLETRMQSFFGARDFVLVNSGSSANLLMVSTICSPELDQLLVDTKKPRLKPGDEIITPAVTFPTTLTPIVQNRMVPVFVDCEVGTYNIDPALIEDAIGPRTRAILLPHTLGNPGAMDVVMDVARRHNLWVLEDSCDALGATFDGKLVGTFGDMASLSFYPAHQMTMGEGGGVIINHPRLKKTARSIRDWGRDCWCDPGKSNTCGKRFGWQFGELPCGYDHKYIYSNLGYNLKPTDLQAAIGLAQIEKVPSFVESRRRNFSRLFEGLKALEDYMILPVIDPRANPSPFGFPITVHQGIDRRAVIQKLEDANIETRLVFGGNILRQPGFAGIEHRVHRTLEQSDIIMRNTFFVGVYPGLTPEMIDYVIETMSRVFREEKISVRKPALANS